MYVFQILLLFGMAEVLYRVIYSLRKVHVELIVLRGGRGGPAVHYRKLNDLRNA